jgi:hypothetical protein
LLRRHHQERIDQIHGSVVVFRHQGTRASKTGFRRADQHGFRVEDETQGSAHDYSGGPPQSCPRDSCLSYGATRRCTLMPPDFFDECLALGLEPSTGGGAGAAPDDDWTLPPECYVWYTDCYLAEPTCPAE